MNERSSRSVSSRLLLLGPLLALVLSACTGGVEDTGDDGYIGGVKKYTIVDPQDRETAPELSGEDLDGKALSTADFAGKTVVVNLWGSWCPPCRKEAPALKAVSDDLADQNVQFVGLLTKDDPASAKAFNAKVGITYPSIVDDDGRNQAAFADTLPSQAIPTTWIIDKNGDLAARIMDDKLSEATLRDLIDDVKTSTP